MKVALEDVRIPAFVGFAMAAWISPFLIVGSIAAMFGAPETHSPLVLTLLFTSLATATVSVLTSSLDRKRTTAKNAENRSVSTFIFVNSAGTMVGLVTNLSESVERWQPAGPNGLTFIYTSIFREEMPLLIYVLLLLPMIGAALYFVLRGSSLLSAREHPSEEELTSLGSWSGSLLALWIFACMRWQPLSWGSETVAATWTVIVYAALLIMGAWLYGLFGLRVVRWLARASFELARAATEVLSDPSTWRAVLLTILVVGGLTGLISVAFLLAGWLAMGIGVLSDLATPEQAQAALRSYTAAVSWTLSVLAKGALGLAAMLILRWTPSLLQAFRRGVGAAIFKGLSGIGSITFRLPSVQRRMGWIVTGFLWGCRTALQAAAARRRAISRLLAVAVPSVFALAASTDGFTNVSTPPSAPAVRTLPPLSPVEPVVSLVPATITTVSFEPASLCDVSAGATEWAYEDDARVSLALSGCRIRTSIGEHEALLVIAMSTNGISQEEEEARATRRLDNLMTWASRELGNGASVYGIDLGMATEPDSHLVLARTFGVSWSERPLLGLIVRSNTTIGDETIRRFVEELLHTKRSLRRSYSKCSIRIATHAGHREVDTCDHGDRAELTFAK